MSPVLTVPEHPSRPPGWPLAPWSAPKPASGRHPPPRPGPLSPRHPQAGLRRKQAWPQSPRRWQQMSPAVGSWRLAVGNWKHTLNMIFNCNLISLGPQHRKYEFHLQHFSHPVIPTISPPQALGPPLGPVPQPGCPRHSSTEPRAQIGAPGS